MINVYTRAPCSGYDTASSGPSPFCTCVKGKNIASVLWTNQKLSGGVVCPIIFFRGTWKVLICNGIFILKDILDEDKKKLVYIRFPWRTKISQVWPSSWSQVWPSLCCGTRVDDCFLLLRQIQWPKPEKEMYFYPIKYKFILL